MNPLVYLSCQGKTKVVPHLPFLFSIIHVDARPIVQRVYKNIINVHASQILH